MFSKANPTFRLRREFELLVVCMRRFLNGAWPSETTDLGDGIQWDGFQALAIRHRVVPQLVQLFSQDQDHSVPVHVVQRLSDLNADLVQQNLRLAAELVRIARRFESQSVSLLAFKGPTLAQELYGSLLGRQFVDLDLLVRPGDVRSAVGLFRELGYRACDVELEPMSSRQLQRAVNDSKSHELYYPEDQAALYVDLHWRLANDEMFFPTQLEALFSASSFCEISGQRIATMPPEQLVNYLAFHGGNHRWMRLSWLCDLAKAVLRVPKSQWNDLIRVSAESKTDRYLVGAWLLMEQLQFVEDVPSTIGVQWRARLDRMTSEMYSVLSADEAAPLLSVLSDGVWRYRFSGSLRPLTNSLIRFLKPKQRDLVHQGWLRPYMSRWQYIATQTATSFWPRGPHRPRQVPGGDAVRVGEK